ncbi:MAG TPA: response regulator transcription factor [Gemmatimonadaceae bacterium]
MRTQWFAVADIATQSVVGASRSEARMVGDVIRIILADDHAVVRAGLRAILGTARDISVVAEASNGLEAIAAAAREPADVIVMDLSMGQLDGISATRQIVSAGSPAKVLVLTMHAEEEYLLAALDAGASGYLVKNAAARELVDAIRALAHGDMYVQPTAVRVLAGRVQQNTPGDEERRRLALLSDRERDVLRLVAEGHSGSMIGEKMQISAKTVDTYKQRINEKLGLAGRPAYVRFALRVGLLTAEANNGASRAKML